VRQKLCSAFLAVTCLLSLSSPVLAAEEGGDIAFSPIGWTFRALNFLILAFGLGWLMRRAPQFFRGRAARIVSAIEESRQIKDESDRLLKDSERRLAGLDKEVGELRVTAQQDAAAEAERIRAAAREEEAKIERAAQAEILAAERTARMEMKALVAHLAVERAESLLRDQVTPDRQAALVRAFVQNVGRAN